MSLPPRPDRARDPADLRAASFRIQRNSIARSLRGPRSARLSGGGRKLTPDGWTFFVCDPAKALPAPEATTRRASSPRDGSGGIFWGSALQEFCQTPAWACSWALPRPHRKAPRPGMGRSFYNATRVSLRAAEDGSTKGCLEYETVCMPVMTSQKGHCSGRSATSASASSAFDRLLQEVVFLKTHRSSRGQLHASAETARSFLGVRPISHNLGQVESCRA